MEAPNPYQKPAPMTKTQSDLIQQENELRNQFAEKRNTPVDPHILLHNVYETSLSFDYLPEDEQEVTFSALPHSFRLTLQKTVPKLLTHHRRLDLSGSSIVSKQQFLQHFEEFTQVRCTIVHVASWLIVRAV